MRNKVWDIVHAAFLSIITLIAVICMTTVFSIAVNMNKNNSPQIQNPSTGNSSNGSGNDNSGDSDSGSDDSGDEGSEEEEEEEEVPPILVNYCQEEPKSCIDREYIAGSDYDSYSDAYKATYKSVVSIQTFVEPGFVMATGSGFIYGVSGDNKSVYILTNAHVINDVYTSGGTLKAKIFEVLYHNNVRVNAVLLAKDSSEDVAILKADIEPDNDFSVAKLGDSDSLEIGDEIFAIGSPYNTNYNNTMTRGIVSNVNVMVDSDNDGDGVATTFYLTQIDAAMSSGNSGGPLFNMKGEVVGINVLKLSVNNSSVITEMMNFSLRINSVINIANAILETGTYARPVIGILATNISGLDLLARDEMGISREITRGLYLNEIDENSPAYGILEAEYIITEINGVKITSFANFTSILLNFSKGDSIELTVVDLLNTTSEVKTIVLG